MITELVFENALTDLHPTEIAALLSCVVFEQKRASEPKLIDTLVQVSHNSCNLLVYVTQRIMGSKVSCMGYMKYIC